MLDISLFIFFIVMPFFGLFEQNLLKNVHNIIAVLPLAGIVAGFVMNRLEEYIDWMLRRLIPLLISAIAVHFFLQTYDSAQIKITLLETGGPLVFMMWIIKRLKFGSFDIDRSRKYAVYAGLMFILSGFLSFSLSGFKLETFEPGILRRISYLGVFLVTVYEFDAKQDFKRILNWILLTCVVVVSYGYIQYLGYDWHIWKGAFGKRIFSTFGNPNFFAAWLVLVLPIILSKILLARDNAKKLMLMSFVVATLFIIWTTGTKGSWVGLAVGFSVFTVLATLWLVEGDAAVLKKIAVTLVAVIVIMAATAITYVSVKGVDSLRFRLFTWGSTMKMISEPVFVSPAKALLLGHGIETFKLVYPSYRRPEIFIIEKKHNTETDHAHNEFLEIFYDEGALGLAIFLLLLINIYYPAFKRLSMTGIGGVKSENEYYLVGLISGTLGMFAHASVSVHVRFVSSGFILWTLLGFIVVHTAPVLRKNELKRKLPDLPVMLMILLLLVLCGTNSFFASRRFTANMFHNRAIAYSKQRMWQQAVEYYRKVQHNHPSFIMAYYFEGNVYNDMLTEAIKNKDQAGIKENYSKAIGMYKKVRSMWPNYVQVHFQEGMLHLKVGDLDKARISFRRYLNIIDPMYPYAYYRLAMIEANKGNMDKAGWYMQLPSQRVNPRKKKEVLESYQQLGNYYVHVKNYAMAEDTYLRGLQALEDNVNLMALLGSLYERWGKKEDALRIYERIREFRPSDKQLIKKIKSLGS